MTESWHTPNSFGVNGVPSIRPWTVKLSLIVIHYLPLSARYCSLLIPSQQLRTVMEGGLSILIHFHLISMYLVMKGRELFLSHPFNLEQLR